MGNERTSGGPIESRGIIHSRATLRYPIRSAVAYKILGSEATISGTGITMDISRSGVSFLCGEALPLGSRATLSIAWPAVLSDGVALLFHVEGHVIRVEDHLTVVDIHRYDFKTTKRS